VILDRKTTGFLTLSTIIAHDHSGADGRNRSLITWLCIEEHSCCVGGEVVWGKVHGFSWWPAQRYYRSGIELISRRTSGGLSTAQFIQNQGVSAVPSGGVSGSGLAPVRSKSSKASSSSSILQLPVPVPVAIDIAHSQTVLNTDVYLRFFLDDTQYVISAQDALTSVVPFLKRVKEVRSGMGKRLSTAYALATSEVEVQRTAICAFRFLSTEHLETFGGLGEATPLIE
jgi:PWWP domain